MADETRHSKAFDAQIIPEPDALARKESFNIAPKMVHLIGYVKAEEP